MKLTDSLAKLLQEQERQSVRPSLWQDPAWKNIFYGHYNRVWDALDKLDKQELVNNKGG